MSGFALKPEISIGELLTIVSVGISVIALLASWSKDRQIRKKEYADRIRRAAGSVIAKMERWVELSLRFFDDIQPVLTDTDVLIAKEQNVTSARDFLWHGLVTTHSSSSQRIVDEQIEIAYVDLYGYDPRVQTLFSITVAQLKAIDETIYVATLNLTQDDVLLLGDREGALLSAQLGNTLRGTCNLLSTECRTLMNEVLKVFRNEMIKIIEARDADIFNKRVKITLIDPIDIAARVSEISQSSATGILIKSKIESWHPSISREAAGDKRIRPDTSL